MSHNNLGALPERIFQSLAMINLQKVYLSNCSLRTVDKSSFNSLVLMIELDLSNNKVNDFNCFFLNISVNQRN